MKDSLRGSVTAVLPLMLIAGRAEGAVRECNAPTVTPSAGGWSATAHLQSDGPVCCVAVVDALPPRDGLIVGTPACFEQ